MSRPQALTPAQRRSLHLIKVERRELIRQLKALPTRAELAAEMNVSERTINRELATKRPRPTLTMLKDLVW